MQTKMDYKIDYSKVTKIIIQKDKSSPFHRCNADVKLEGGYLSVVYSSNYTDVINWAEQKYKLNPKIIIKDEIKGIVKGGVEEKVLNH